MATVFQCVYPSIKGGTFRVNIDDGGPGGTPTQIDIAAGGAVIRYNGDGKDRLNPIVGSSCDINVVVTADTDSAIQTFATNLIGSAEGRYTISIEYNGGTGYELYWCGYVLPDLSGFEDLADTYTFRITGTDGLARLKGIEYSVGTFPTATPYGNIPFIAHILNCLNEDGLSGIYFTSGTFLRTVVNWVDSTIGSPAAGKDPLALTRVSGQLFAKRNGANAGDLWDFKSCYEVLEIICRHWCARLIFSGGCYRFEQINERSLDAYPERRYTAAGTLSSSAINAQADKLIDNSAIGHKIAVVTFNYLPAIKRTVVRYDHQTNKNYLAGLGYKWFKDSGNNNALTVDNIEFDDTTLFRVSGRIYFDLEIAAYTDPWRYIFRMDIVLDTGHRLRSFTDPGVDGSGNPINIIIREPQAWEVSSVYYEISTDFFYGTTATTFLDFSIITPVLPSGVESFTIDFDTLAGEKNTGNNQLVTVKDWRFSDLVLIIINSDDDNNYEDDRYYRVQNATTGNSEVVEFDSIFGHAVKPWTPTKLQTSANGSTWTDTTATWKQGTDATNYEFGNLIAAEILSGQDRPLKLLDGSLAGKGIYPHSRIVTTDDVGYLLMQGEFETQTGVVNGTWFAAGVNRGHTSGPIVKVPNPTTFPPATPGGGGSTGQFQTESNVKGTPGGLAELGLAAQATNYVSAAVTAGTVTSIPLKFAVKANAYLAGDDIFLVNPQNGRIEGFTVSVTANAGDTSLSVTSKTIDYDFPKDTYVLYSVLNKYTGEGGDGENLPDGSLGQILRHNGTQWTPYSGATDGHVLTWDNTNGWQAEAIAGGSVTSVGLSMPSGFSVSGSPVTSSGTLAVTTSLNGPVRGNGSGFTTGNINLGTEVTGTLKTENGGTGLSAIGSALQVLRVNAGGTALEYATPTNGTVTSVALAAPGIFLVTGSPVTGSGTLQLSLNDTANNYIFAGPASGGAGAPTFRSMVDADIPNLATTKITSGVFPVARGGTGLASIGSALQVLRVNAGGTALEYATLTSGIGGSIAATQVAYGSGANTIAGSNNLKWDNTNLYFQIGSIGSPSANLGIAPVGTSGTKEVIRAEGSTSGLIYMLLSNAWNSSNVGGVQLQLTVGGANAGDPYIVMGVSGAATWAIGVDNSVSDVYRIIPNSSPSSGTNGLTLTNESTVKMGLNNTTPSFEIDNNTGRTRSQVFINTNSAPTFALGVGAGTGATASVTGGKNGFYVFLTTGTSPSASAPIITITYGVTGASGSNAVFSAANTQAATDIAKVLVSSTSGTQCALQSNGTLSASTSYAWRFNVEYFA